MNNIERPGRFCPPHYSYRPEVFNRAPDFVANTVYVVGGLYGNSVALDAIEAMARQEEELPTLVFNGDFHWFDIDPARFAHVQQRVTSYLALRGNVETEIASDSNDAGCGCAYPDSVAEDDVERSNQILWQLRQVASEAQVLKAKLANLPMHLVAQIGDSRVGIVHGDAWSLAGWRFAYQGLADQVMITRAFERAQVDGFASTHTCLPALRVYSVAGKERFIVNNGAAGMANFHQTQHGVITRLSNYALPESLAKDRLYGADSTGIYVDALALRFSSKAWEQEFLSQWPPHSAAYDSYWERIQQGPKFSVAHALGQIPYTDVMSCTVA